jgi:tetratricopeptide (TPR) repeat protein
MCGALACSGGVVSPPVDAAGLQAVHITQVDLSQEEFAPRVKALLVDGEATPKRLNDLVAVVRHQLHRANTYLDSGHEQAALDALMGALFLVRAGEFRGEMLVGVEDSLLGIAALVAKRGDEGRTEALYSLVAPQLSETQAKRDAAEHLEAIRRWQEDTRESGSMEAAGARRTAAAKRALVWRTPENLDVAQRRTTEWVERAFVVGREDAPPRDYFEFDERTEAHRAVMLGAPSMAALYLRDGDAAGAVAALESEPMAAIADSKLLSRLNDAADGDADAWADMYGFFESTGRSGRVGLDPDLARGAAWGAAVALYRTDHQKLRSVIPLATLLVEHGMAEVAPLLFNEALGDRPDARELTWVLRLLMQALVDAERHSDLAQARRIFSHSRGLVKLAGSEGYLGRVRPAAPDFWYAMGAMESRAGALDRARPHLQSAVRAVPTPQALRLLAAIDRQSGNLGAALASLTQMLTMVRAQGDAATEAATQIIVSDLLRDLGKHAEAAAALQAALDRVLEARRTARTGHEVASAERILADVLERYGEVTGANRAVERAEDAARSDLGQLTATLLDAARRALVLGDLDAGRRVMRNALDSDLSDQDLVYTALWVKLLHERVRAPSDGSYEEALARTESDGSWTSTLRDWARGALTDAQLTARATDVVERIEARFYVALSAHLREANAESLQQLRDVATSEAIELVEVRLARDFISVSQGVPRLTFPTGVTIP